MTWKRLILAFALLVAPSSVSAATAYVVTETTTDGMLIQDEYNNVWYEIGRAHV